MMRIKYFDETSVTINELKTELFTNSSLAEDQKDELIINLETIMSEICKNVSESNQIISYVKQVIFYFRILLFPKNKLKF